MEIKKEKLAINKGSKKYAMDLLSPTISERCENFFLRELWDMPQEEIDQLKVCQFYPRFDFSLTCSSFYAYSNSAQPQHSDKKSTHDEPANELASPQDSDMDMDLDDGNECGEFRVHVVVCGCVWLCVVVCGCMLLYAVVCGCIYAVACGCIFLYVVVCVLCGCMWLLWLYVFVCGPICLCL